MRSVIPIKICRPLPEIERTTVHKMAASILTPQQQQRTIRKSDKSVNKKKLVRKTLLSPFQKPWPKISTEDEKKLIEVLATILIELNIGRLPKIIYPDDLTSWKERYAFKKKLQSEHWKNTSQDRNHIVLGTNAVTRALEKNQLAAILVSKDVNPNHMVDFLASLAATRGIRGTKISNLRLSMMECLCFKSCAVIGFKRSVEDSTNPFHKFYKLMYEVVPPFDNALVTAFEVSSESLLEEKEPKHTKEAKPKEETNIDYSHLYTYRGEHKTKKPNPSKRIFDFLALEKDIQEIPTKKGKHKEKLKKKIPYLTTNLKQIQASGKVKKRKKNSKNEIIPC